MTPWRAQQCLGERQILGCIREVALHPGNVHPERVKKATEKCFVDADAEERTLWQALSGLTNARDREGLVRKLRNLRLQRFMDCAGSGKRGDQPLVGSQLPADAAAPALDEDAEPEEQPPHVHPDAAIPAYDEQEVERIADEALDEFEAGDQPPDEAGPAAEAVPPADAGDQPSPVPSSDAAVLDEVLLVSFDWGAFYFTPKGEVSTGRGKLHAHFTDLA